MSTPESSSEPAVPVTSPLEPEPGEPPKPKTRPGCGALVLGLAVMAGAALLLTLLTSVIWPGEARLTAPLFCPDHRPDAYVVVDSYSSAPGETSYDFSLYCMGDRGDVTEVGWFRPQAVLLLAHWGLLVGAFVLSGVVVGLRQRMRRARMVVGPPPLR